MITINFLSKKLAYYIIIYCRMYVLRMISYAISNIINSQYFFNMIKKDIVCNKNK